MSVCLTLLFTSFAFAAQPIRVFVDKEKINFNKQPIMMNGTTLVEFRPIFEKLGLQIGWDNATQTITGQKDGLSIKLTIGSKTAMVNNQTVSLLVEPKIIDGYTFVPLRFIGETTKKNVKWLEDISAIIIGDDNIPGLYSDAVIKNRIYNLSDDDIKQAIYEGRKDDFLTTSRKLKQMYGLPVKGKDLGFLTPEAEFNTPYRSIMLESMMKKFNNESYSFNEAKEWTKEDNLVGFTLVTYGGSITMGKVFDVDFKQNGKTLQPIHIFGKDDLASRTPYWPNSPSYQLPISAVFPKHEIDFSKPAELIFYYIPNTTVTYSIDFKKYR